MTPPDIAADREMIAKRLRHHKRTASSVAAANLGLNVAIMLSRDRVAMTFTEWSESWNEHPPMPRPRIYNTLKNNWEPD